MRKARQLQGLAYSKCHWLTTTHQSDNQSLLPALKAMPSGRSACNMRYRIQLNAQDVAQELVSEVVSNFFARFAQNMAADGCVACGDHEQLSQSLACMRVPTRAVLPCSLVALAKVLLWVDLSDVAAGCGALEYRDMKDLTIWVFGLIRGV